VRLFFQQLNSEPSLSGSAMVMVQYLVSTFRNDGGWVVCGLPEGALLHDLKKKVEEIEGISIGWFD
jgi:hypothetical protein